MGAKWRVHLFYLVLIVVLAGACRKNRSFGNPSDPGRGNGPDLPGTPPPSFYSLKPVHAQLSSTTAGYYEALPRGYDTSSAKYPLLVFLHGGGEVGSGVEDLQRVLRNSVPRRIRNGSFPETIVSGGRSFSFVVIAPQFSQRAKPDDVHRVIRHAIDHYKVDTQRIYLSGLSMGGGATWDYAAKYGYTLAAIVPICGASWADAESAERIADAGLPVWAFHNSDDSVVTVNSTTRYINMINANNPRAEIRMTLWPTGGHDAWTRASDPGYREENLNIYEWMLRFRREVN